jgi:hypothetical protein
MPHLRKPNTVISEGLYRVVQQLLVNSSGDSAGDELKYARDQPRMTGTEIPGIG